MQARRAAVRVTVDAGKQRFERADLDELLRGARRVVVAKGRRHSEFELAAGRVLPDEVAEALLGPTGKLRAPTVRAGTTWIVGFLPEVWEHELG